MNPKIKKGLQWFKFIAMLCFFFFFSTVEDAFIFKDLITTRITIDAIMVMLSSWVVIGIPAFVLGWLKAKA